MSKHHSLDELLSSNNDISRQDKFQMKTKICPHLPHLQTTKKNSTKFPNTLDSYATTFSK